MYRNLWRLFSPQVKQNNNNNKSQKINLFSSVEKCFFHHQNITLTCAKYNRNFSTYYTLPNLDSIYDLI